MKDLSNLIIRLSVSVFATLILGALFFTAEQKYELTIKEKRPWLIDKNTTYLDLNSDGKTERILLSNAARGQIGLIIYNSDDMIIDQFNFIGRYVNRSNIYKGDYNNDGLSEIYVFTYVGDSLFLNILEGYNMPDPLIRRRYIEGCTSLHGEAQYIISAPVFEDVNDDGFKEFYFSISAGFTLQPRAQYYYDIINDILKKTDPAGVAPRYSLSSYDINRDGKLEIWGTSNAVGNYKTNIPYSDSSAWLMIYNHQLEYEFEPIEFKGFGTVLNTSVLETEEDIKLVVLRTNSTRINFTDNELAVFSTTGDLLVRKSLNEYNLSNGIQTYISGQKIFLADIDGNILIFNQCLDLIKQDNKKYCSGTMYGPFKIPGIEEELVLFLNAGGELQVLTAGLKKLASIYLDDDHGSYFEPVFICNKNISSGFHFRTSSVDFGIEMVRNKSRNYIYLYSLIMFASFYFLIYFIQVLQKKQEDKKRQIESRMRTLQMQAVKSQVSPHFIFNALNSISAMYIKGDATRADEFLTRFSRMIREVVDSSDKLVVTLAEEINFVKNYLELEQVRHKDRLSFGINMPDDCKLVNLPSMSIHTFVENSIKHGFRGKDKMHILINVICHSKALKITIEDNGAGYNYEKEGAVRQGKGLQMIKDIFDTYYAISGKKINYSILDIGDNQADGKHGSLVEINAEI